MKTQETALEALANYFYNDFTAIVNDNIRDLQNQALYADDKELKQINRQLVKLSKITNKVTSVVYEITKL